MYVLIYCYSIGFLPAKRDTLLFVVFYVEAAIYFNGSTVTALL